MIPKECKRLAEVDFPIAAVSKHAAKEKSIRHGLPSTLHLWWARRPLAACRAMLLALLFPDPCDEHCPADFKERARPLLAKLMGTVAPKDEDLRRALLRFIGEFADWDVSSHPVWLEVGRGLVKAAHPEETPLVVDPFAGGGSIPLESLRIGCEAFASDLNPVACLILKVMLEDIPRHGTELAEEVRRIGTDVKNAAEKDLDDFYPADSDGARPIAYIWARTVRCESPNCGAEIPLARFFWLCKKANRKSALRYTVVRPKGHAPHLAFDVFTPKDDAEVPSGTVSRAKATCPCCNVTLGPDRVRTQLREQRGGADTLFDNTGQRIGGATLLAVVTLREHQQGRHYRVSTKADYIAAWKAGQRLVKVANSELPGGLSAVPDETLPLMSGTFNAPIYGASTWGDLFSARQKLALITLAAKIRSHKASLETDFLPLILSKFAELCTANCPWEPVAECPRKMFNMQAIPTRWEFAEAVVTSDSSGGFSKVVDNFASTLHAIGANWNVGQSQAADACQPPIPSDSCALWFTDPPYYFAVPYADLSDFFYVWLKRAVAGSRFAHNAFEPNNPLTPKGPELCQMAHWDKKRYAHKDKAFFEEGMFRAFTAGRTVLQPDGIGCVVFAHKTTEGWEALLSAIARAGWVITASWPIVTEQAHRPRARDSAALATSVHLVCRPRSQYAGIGDWTHVIRDLPKRVGDWMERLQSEGIRGADLVFACIGPALEIYSRYEKVVDAEEREIPLGGDPTAKEPHLRGYLAYVWEVVGRMALEQILGTAEAKARNGAAGALEEDARLTALFLWTMQATDANATDGDVDEEDDDTDDEDDDAPRAKKKAGYNLLFDVVRRFAQPLGIHLPEWEHRIIETEKGVVRLLPVSERARLLFGEEGADAVADWLQSGPEKSGSGQMMLFGEEPPTPKRAKKGRTKSDKNVSDETLKARREATTLDRVHMAMLLQASGRTNALRALLQAEQDRSPDFVRLSNALSALYPKESEEKRLLDAMLLAVPR